MVRNFVRTAAIGLVLAVPLTTVATAAQAGASEPAAAAACAALKVSATPRVNAQNAPNETIKSRVTNCSTTIETVTLVQRVGISGGPEAAGLAKTWTLTLMAGQTVDKVRYIPYSCCGTYTVRDKVYSRTNRLLRKAATSFTFA